MCEPTTIAALSIASTAVGTVNQYQTAKTQGRAAAQQLAARQEEQSAQTSTEIGRRAKQGRAERARLRVAAGEAGVGGGSFEAALRTSLAQDEHDAELLKLQSRYSSRANVARYRSTTASVDGPNLALAGLQIAGTVQKYRSSRLTTPSSTRTT